MQKTKLGYDQLVNKAASQSGSNNRDPCDGTLSFRGVGTVHVRSQIDNGANKQHIYIYIIVQYLDGMATILTMS